MPSYKKIQLDSPRVGIIKSTKNVEQDKSKEQKRIKIDIIESKKTISIKDNDSVSLDNHENATQKGETVTIKSIEPVKKGCLKHNDGSGVTGLSLKKIALGQDAELADCKSTRSTKSIKFNKKTNVYVYRKDWQKSESRSKRHDTIKRAMQESPALVEASEEDQCCVIF